MNGIQDIPASEFNMKNLLDLHYDEERSIVSLKQNITYNKSMNATFTIYTDPGLENEIFNTVNKFYDYPEARLYDKKVAKVTKEIITKNEDCLIFTQSEIVINQFLIKLKNNELNVENVKMRYIDENGETIDLDVKQHGRIRKAPRGFMEQYREDLMALL